MGEVSHSVSYKGVIKAGLTFWCEIKVRALDRLLCFSDLQLRASISFSEFY